MCLWDRITEYMKLILQYGQRSAVILITKVLILS